MKRSKNSLVILLIITVVHPWLMQNLSLGSLYMLYDRTYMQSPRELFKRSFCDQLIIFLVSCFVLQAVSSLFFGAQLVNDFVGFGYNNLIKGYFWTIITYASVHDGPLHLILNLLGIHFIGRPVEDFIGNRKFKFLVLSSVLLGAIIWILFNKSGFQYLVGSSAIVLACLCTFCLFQPNQPITLLLFFILPVRIKPKWILLGTLGLEIYGFVNSEILGNGMIAHSAHLGGMLCGAFTYLVVQEKLVFPFRFTFTTPGTASSQSRHNRHLSKKFRVNFGENVSIKEETDRILDKINEKGFGSLTELEKETLEKAKKLLGKD
jgi:membrane associated rhomboid family serine protease